MTTPGCPTGFAAHPARRKRARGESSLDSAQPAVQTGVAPSLAGVYRGRAGGDGVESGDERAVNAWRT
jgi:hypothetical protein